MLITALKTKQGTLTTANKLLIQAQHMQMSYKVQLAIILGEMQTYISLQQNCIKAHTMEFL